MIEKINEILTYIGVDDTDIDLFESQYRVPAGISYNSYIILDDKVAIMDTVDGRKGEEWKENLQTALEGRSPDYLIVQHMEPDHSSLIAWAMDRYPEMKVVATAAALKMLPAFFEGIGLEGRTVCVGENDTLELGHHTLRFILAPMVHWPEVMVTYDETEKRLFSADAFGTFDTVRNGLFLTDIAGWTSEARRYYINICGKYGQQVGRLLGKLQGAEISSICSLHGPILVESAIAGAVELYSIWSSYEPESKDGVMVAYASIHGGTARVAEMLAAMLKDRGVKDVVLTDLSRADMSGAVADAFRCGSVVFAASSYDAGLFPPMHDFIWHLQIKNWQNRRVAVIENGSWAISSGRVMTEMLSAMKGIDFVADKMTVRSRLHACDIETLENLAEAICRS